MLLYKIVLDVDEFESTTLSTTVVIFYGFGISTILKNIQTATNNYINL